MNTRTIHHVVQVFSPENFYVALSRSHLVNVASTSRMAKVTASIRKATPISVQTGTQPAKRKPIASQKPAKIQPKAPLEPIGTLPWAESDKAIQPLENRKISKFEMQLQTPLNQERGGGKVLSFATEINV